MVGLGAYGFFVNLNLLILRPALPELNGTWLYNAIMGFVELVTFDVPFLQALLFLGMSFLLVYLLHLLYKDLEITEAPSLLVPFCAFLLMGMFNRFFYYAPSFFAAFALALALRRIFAAYHKRSVAPIFDAAFLLGLSCLIYSPNFVLVFFLGFYLLFIRSTTWREWALSIVGLLLPFYLLAAYTYLTGQFDVGTLSSFRNDGAALRIWQTLEPWRIAAFFIVLGILGYGLSILFPYRYARNNIFMKDHFSMILLLLVLLIVAVLGFETQHNSGFALLVVPLSLLLAFSFGAYRNVLKAEIIHVTLVLILLVFQFGPLI